MVLRKTIGTPGLPNYAVDRTVGISHAFHMRPVLWYALTISDDFLMILLNKWEEYCFHDGDVRYGAKDSDICLR